MGGYLTFPLAAAARLARIPAVLHESNAILGLANRLSLPMAQGLALGLPLAKAPGGARAKLVGTPVREALWARGDAASARAALGLEPGLATLLVFGGSQGAGSINRAVPRGLALLKIPFQVLHLAGKNDPAEVERLYREGGVRARVLPYLDAMELAYAAADSVLCRSGAATLAELAAQAKPALLIPFPSAAAGHQELNAAVFERAGAARMLKEPLAPGAVADALRPLLSDPEVRSSMSKAYARVDLPAPQDSVRMLADMVQEAARHA
jgi:UDP-N-acetylglucosamine--N-acetylmuramyl-(pentapeptide) pyrophosphoryl-undecaprenol N-acetylglucosamine transferase